MIMEQFANAPHDSTNNIVMWCKIYVMNFFAPQTMSATNIMYGRVGRLNYPAKPDLGMNLQALADSA